MKCPDCNQEPIPFGRYVLKLNPYRIKCRNCGSILGAKTFTRIISVILLVAGCILGIVIGYTLGVRIESEFTLAAGIITVFVIPVGIVISFVAWKYGCYARQ